MGSFNSVAIAYARVRFIGRSTGGNAVRSAAYNLRGIIVDQRTGQNFNFSQSERDPVLHHEIMLPAGASAAFQDASRLWNAAEQAENRKNSQVAKEVVIALPIGPGISDQDRIELARQFACEQFIERGVAVQLNIHHGVNENPHAHLLVTTRRVDGDRLASHKARDLDPVVRPGVNSRKFVPEAQKFGAAWAELQDRYFREHGLAVRVDPTGIVPGQHIGPVRHRREGSRKAAQDGELRQQNAAAVLDPERVIAHLTRDKATFTEREVTRLLVKAGLDKPKVAEVRTQVMGHASVLTLYDPQTGELAERYTTHAIRAQERNVMAEAVAVAAMPHPSVARAPPSWMNAGQAEAYCHALSAGGLKIVEGRAGTGKTATLSAIRDGLVASGRYRVVGMAPTNTVVADMRAKEGFKEAQTAHSWLFRLKNGRDRWDARTAVVIDEAAMQSTAIAGEVLSQARMAGAKVVLVGDDRQLASIERGGMFTELAKVHGSVEITEVVRQSQEWQRLASQDMAAGRFHSAVERLEAGDAVQWRETRRDALAALVGAWARDVREAPERRRMAFAWTNADVEMLNAEMRAIRQGRGELGPELRFRTLHGEADFAIGDRIAFTKTEKLDGIYNGETATITQVWRHRIEATTDSGRSVRWDPREFDGFRHGYAGTIYKGQGQTLDDAYVLHSKHWRAPAAYVALTRQRETLKLFVATNEAANARELAEQMGRPEMRSASLRWEDDRTRAVDKAVEIGKAMQEAERAKRTQELKAISERKPANLLEHWGRQIIARNADYDAVYRRLAVQIQEAKPKASWAEIDRAVSNRLDWAMKRAREWDAATRQRLTTEGWARFIVAERATFDEAKAALRDKFGEQAAEKLAEAVFKVSVQSVSVRRSA